MTRSLQAIYEQGVLRPLEPLPFRDQQEVTVTVSDEASADWLDSAFLSHLEMQADDTVTLERVRTGLSKIPGSMAEDFQRERDDPADLEGLGILNPQSP